MTVKREFLLTDELAERRYSQLIRALVRLATSFRFVILRPPELLESSALDTMAELSSWLSNERDVTAWPGTQIFGTRTAHLMTYKACDESADVLLRHSRCLYDWVAPVLPDDLHFSRTDGTTVLGNVAHERDAWLELSDDEYDALLSEIPALAAGLRLRENRP